MSGRAMIPLHAFADRLTTAKIHWPNGWKQNLVAVEEVSIVGDVLRVKAEFFLLPAPAVETRPGESTGGFVVPTELADAVRTGLQIIGQPVAVPLEPELSDWIDGSVAPTIVGVYEREYPVTLLDEVTRAFSLWDGKSWHSYETTADRAALNSHISAFQCAPWRGLRHDPTRGTGA
jgi:hypothetical protein